LARVPDVAEGFRVPYRAGMACPASHAGVPIRRFAHTATVAAVSNDFLYAVEDHVEMAFAGRWVVQRAGAYSLAVDWKH